MNILKNAQKPPLVFTLPYYGGYMSPDTDASIVQIGYVLLEKQPNHTTERTKYCSS